MPQVTILFRPTNTITSKDSACPDPRSDLINMLGGIISTYYIVLFFKEDLMAKEAEVTL